jgi:hypothetical protein
MRGLTAQDILAVWEAGQDQHPVDRALTMLEPALPDSDRASLAALPVGQRDSLLFRLREAVLGPRLRGLADCPKCHCRVEFTLKTDTLCAGPPPAAENALKLAGRRKKVRFRLPDSFDLAHAAVCSDVPTARAAIARRCLLGAKETGKMAKCESGRSEEDAAPELSQTEVEQLAAAMEKADPQAEVLLDLRCPDCANEWQAALDIASFFWHELTAMSRDMLEEVAVLARAYGWSEGEILNMSQARRRLYMERLA